MGTKKGNYLFTSEAVSHGHPDKVCDQISDSILDAYMRQDTSSRVAVECMVTKNKVILSGEIKSSAKVDVKKVVRNKIKEIGYTNPKHGFSHKAKIYNFLHEQTSELQENSNNNFAGDQGIMFGYACNETIDFMPFTSSLANYLLNILTYVDYYDLVKDGVIYPDAKCQVTVKYVNDKIVEVDSVVLSVSHSNKLNFDDLKKQLSWLICYETGEFIRKYSTNTKIKYKDMNKFINPAGEWHSFGPAADSGVTGRKIVIDSYGGCAPVGGGAYSGKDVTKVDRTANYMARYIAKNIVYNGLATECLIELAYIIGHKNPISINVRCKNNKLTEDEIINLIKSQFDLTVSGMIRELHLECIDYSYNCIYSHFGTILIDFGNENIRPWENTFIFSLNRESGIA